VWRIKNKKTQGAHRKTQRRHRDKTGSEEKRGRDDIFSYVIGISAFIYYAGINILL